MHFSSNTFQVELTTFTLKTYLIHVVVIVCWFNHVKILNCRNYETCAKLHRFHNLYISHCCLPLIISAVTSATMTTKSFTTLTSYPVTTTAVSTSAVKTSKKPVTTVCKDQALCSDPHTRNTACDDKYIAANFCPKMCGICGKYRCVEFIAIQIGKRQ